jgi:hypothetical protein
MVKVVTVAWVLVGLLAVCPASASAQDCASDTFQTVRRARAVVAQYEAFHDRHRADLARNEAFAEQTGQPLPWRFDLAGLVGFQQTFGFETCTNMGPWGAKFTGMQLGALASVDLYSVGVGLEAFYLLAPVNLVASPTVDQTRTEDGGFAEPVGLANVSAGERIYGGRLTLHRWASLVAARVESRPVSNVEGVDGRIIEIPLEPAGRPRYYLGIGTPLGGGLLHLLFDARDVATDVVGLRFGEIPLPTPHFDGVAGAAYLRDEQKVTLELGVTNVFELFTFTAQTEMAPVRLRSVVARVDWSGGPQKVVRSTDPQTGEEHAMRLALDFGTFAQVSYFDSAHVEAVVDRRRLLGTRAGLTVRPDATILMMQLDFWFGLNDPAELSRISDYADRWQVGVDVHGRFGL